MINVEEAFKTIWGKIMTLEGVQQKIPGLEGRFGSILAHLGEMEKKQQALVSRIALLEGTLGGLRKDIARYKPLLQQTLRERKEQQQPKEEPAVVSGETVAAAMVSEEVVKNIVEEVAATVSATQTQDNSEEQTDASEVKEDDDRKKGNDDAATAEETTPDEATVTLEISETE